MSIKTWKLKEGHREFHVWVSREMGLIEVGLYFRTFVFVWDENRKIKL